MHVVFILVLIRFWHDVCDVWNLMIFYCNSNLSCRWIFKGFWFLWSRHLFFLLAHSHWMIHFPMEITASKSETKANEKGVLLIWTMPSAITLILFSLSTEATHISNIWILQVYVLPKTIHITIFHKCPTQLIRFVLFATFRCLEFGSNRNTTFQSYNILYCSISLEFRLSNTLRGARIS